MKTKFLIVIFLLSAFFVGCKNEKSNNTNELSVAKEENNFKVKLTVTVKKDDTFSLFYTEDGSTDFSKIQPIWLNVKGSNSPQDIVFNLPEDVIPSQLRLDFGLSKDQEEMVIDKFGMNYFGKSFEIPGDKFYLYFDPDKSKTIFDKDKRTINAVFNSGVRQFPSFYPNTKPLGEEIQKLVK
jgi:hypothetical protein